MVGITLICLNAESGELIWQNKKTMPFDDFTSPTVYNGKVYISTRCVDLGTGQTIWQNEIDESTNQVNRFSKCSFCNGRMYVGGLDVALTCLDAKTGKKIWCYGKDDYGCAVPVIANGFIYLSYLDHMCSFGSYKTNNSVRIELSSASDTVCIRKELKISAKVYDEKDNLIENAPLDWSVQPDSAFLEEDGTLYCLEPCKAIVTCRSNDLIQNIEISVIACDDD